MINHKNNNPNGYMNIKANILYKRTFVMVENILNSNNIYIYYYKYLYSFENKLSVYRYKMISNIYTI